MSLVAWVSATYSDSVLERVIMGCFLALHEMAPILTKKAKPEIVGVKVGGPISIQKSHDTSSLASRCKVVASECEAEVFCASKVLEDMFDSLEMGHMR